MTTGPASAGRSAFIVAGLLGHARPDTVRACTGPTAEDRAKDLELLAAGH